MAKTSGLTIRQHERQSIELRIEVVVLNQHRQQVCFSPGSSALDSFAIRGTATDISPGGMGLVLEQFIPKMCEGTVRVFSATAVGKSADGSPIHDVIFEHQVKFRRVYMNSHQPTYAAGVSFVDAGPGLDIAVEEVLLAGNLRQPPEDGASSDA